VEVIYPAYSNTKNFKTGRNFTLVCIICITTKCAVSPVGAEDNANKLCKTCSQNHQANRINQLNTMFSGKPHYVMHTRCLHMEALLTQQRMICSQCI